MTARRLVPLLSLVLLAALPASAQAQGIASATGVKHVNGEAVYVDVLVAVPANENAQQATDRALSEQGASRSQKPPWAGSPGGPGGGGGGGEEYFYTGLEWTLFPVLQSYNPASAPTNINASAALANTQADWSSAGSAFRLESGGQTSRCPSLVQQCKGPQLTDGFNDVGWASLGGSTLGVTWFTISNPEADMALSNRFAWKQTCDTSGGSAYDVETVFLHENGHVAGLDHTDETASVMYPSYQGPRCELTGYDRDAIANLYG